MPIASATQLAKSTQLIALSQSPFDAWALRESLPQAGKPGIGRFEIWSHIEL